MGGVTYENDFDIDKSRVQLDASKPFEPKHIFLCKGIPT